jgi:hypothetical protein
MRGKKIKSLWMPGYHPSRLISVRINEREENQELVDARLSPIQVNIFVVRYNCPTSCSSNWELSCPSSNNAI